MRHHSVHPPPGPVRVAIGDNHEVVSAGLRMILEIAGTVAVIWSARDGAEALDLLGRSAPDVLILDVMLPDLSGIELARRVRAAWPDLGVVAVSGYDAADYAPALTEARVRAFIGKGSRGFSADLRAAVQAVGRSGQPMARAKRACRPAPGGGLTLREGEVLDLADAGLPTAAIARSIGVSENTVKKHLQNVYGKLGVGSRTAAIHAYRRGRGEA